MTVNELLSQIALGEDSTRQFKLTINNVESLASELAAFANSEGGVLYIGVDDNGLAVGLSSDEVQRVNQMISNAASQHIRSPLTVHTENLSVNNGRIVVVINVPKGIDKPYFDRNGVIWLKCGADKRRINSKEELRRLFQVTDQFHADELPTKYGVEVLDKLRLRDFLRDVYKQDYPDSDNKVIQLLKNMNLATSGGFVNLAGLLLFGERPEWLKPQFIIKAICYPGNDINTTKYLDNEDFYGSMRKIFDNAMSFITRNLRKIQAGRGINSPGTPEIPLVVFEELLVNALIHRDYLISATIKLFIFDNRIEIISPGSLPDNLTVEKIIAGNSNIRNPIIASYAAKGLLPYSGLGSGIKRALEAWSKISFNDDRESGYFTVTIYRSPLLGSDKSSDKSSDKVLKLLKEYPTITAKDIARQIGISQRAVEKQISKLKKEGLLSRIGHRKGGAWKVTE